MAPEQAKGNRESSRLRPDLSARAPRWFALLSLALALLGSAAARTDAVVADPDGALGATRAPVSIPVTLTAAQRAAARSGRLGAVETGTTSSTPAVLPVQWILSGPDAPAIATWQMPPGPAGSRTFHWQVLETPFTNQLAAAVDATSGQVEVTDAGRPVLRYNHRTVEPGAVTNQVAEGNRIYARARSDYLHPLYDLDGVPLTRDWSLDHPHHRGIYWAWPEVDFGTERGDLHALQRVFARPTPDLDCTSGPVFAQVTAGNRWLWEDREPIVRERVVIRAYAASLHGRVVDLEFQFVGLKPGVTVARRGTTAYGGLNLRLATPRDQVIAIHTDPPGALPRRAWSDLSGVFSGTRRSGLTVLPRHDNPDHPGDWVQYPELSWVQPAFPASGTRYPLPPDRPLVLRYRLWIHADAATASPTPDLLWAAWHQPATALPVTAALPNSASASPNP